MQQRAPDRPRALAVRAPARQQRSRVLDQWERVRLAEEVRCLRRRPRRRVPPRTVEARAGSLTRRPTARAREAGRSIRQSPRRAYEEQLRAAKVYRAGAQPHSRLHRFRPRCRQSGASRWQVPRSRHKQLSGASRRHRLMRATEARQQDRFCHLPRPCPVERVVTVWQAVPAKQPHRRTRLVQIVLVWCRM